MTEETENNTGEITLDLARIREEGIFVMCPAYAGQCFAHFAKSLIGLTKLCTQYQIPLEFFFIYNESLIPRARNYSVDEFLRRKFKIQYGENGPIEEKFYQHGMFIDSDIEFNPMDVLVLAHLQSVNPAFDVVCAPYSMKVISWEKVKEAVDKGLADEDPDDLSNYTGDYVFNTVNGQPITIGKPSQVYESGTGFMMFRRDTLLKLQENNPNITFKPDHRRTANFDGSRELYAFFDTHIDPVSKRYLSEDYYFCKLCRESDLGIWLIPWPELKHHGYYVYGGSMAKQAQAGISAKVDVSKIKKK